MELSSKRRPRAAWVLTALLILSLGGNAVLARAWRHAEADLAALRLDPIGLTIYPALADSSLPPSDARVVFFGDSRAQFWPDPPGFPQLQFVNRGIGRQTSAQALERFERHVAYLRPRVVVIELGVNDLKEIATFPERADAITRACIANLDAIVARARALGARVVVTTVFPVGPVPIHKRSLVTAAVRRAIDDVNTHIRGIAGDGTFVYDAAPVLSDRSGATRADFSVDHLHLNDAGYAALNQGLSPILAKLVADAQR